MTDKQIEDVWALVGVIFMGVIVVASMFVYN